MLNVIINEELYDKEFVEKWTFGFGELKQRVQEYSPDKVAEITWVPGEKIIEAARLFATNKPASVNWSQPIDANPEGTVVCQAINHLWAITGNIDIPGGMVIAQPSHGVSNYPFNTQDLLNLYGEELIKKLSEKRIGADRYPLVKNFRGWAQPDVLIEQMETGKPYPIKGAWIQTSNIIGGQAIEQVRAVQDVRYPPAIVCRQQVGGPLHCIINYHPMIDGIAPQVIALQVKQARLAVAYDLRARRRVTVEVLNDPVEGQSRL